MTVLKRQASTVFDRSNFSIMDVMDMSDAVPVSYPTKDLFAFYQFIFTINTTSTEFTTSTPFSFLLTMSSYLGKPEDTSHIQTLGDSQTRRFQEFLATPMVIYNDGWFGANSSDPDTKNKVLSLATQSYRVVSQRTLTDFVVAHLARNTPFVLNRRDTFVGLVFGSSCIHLTSNNTRYITFPRNRFQLQVINQAFPQLITEYPFDTECFKLIENTQRADPFGFQTAKLSTF
jgi:hypothetical protein